MKRAAIAGGAWGLFQVLEHTLPEYGTAERWLNNESDPLEFSARSFEIWVAKHRRKLSINMVNVYQLEEG